MREFELSFHLWTTSFIFFHCELNWTELTAPVDGFFFPLIYQSMIYLFNFFLFVLLALLLNRSHSSVSPSIHSIFKMKLHIAEQGANSSCSTDENCLFKWLMNGKSEEQWTLSWLNEVVVRHLRMALQVAGPNERREEQKKIVRIETESTGELEKWASSRRKPS